MKMIRTIGLGLLLALLLGACTAGRRAFDEGRDNIHHGNIEAGLDALEKAQQQNAGNIEYKSYYLRQKELYIRQLLNRGDGERAAKSYADADATYRHVFQYDPGNQHASDAIKGIRHDRRHDAMVVDAAKLLKAGKTEEAQAIVHTVLAEDPRQEAARKIARELEQRAATQKSAEPALGAAFRKPISLEFRNASLQAIFEVISRATQINFVFDHDVRPDLKSTIFVKNTTIEDVINLLMVTNQLQMRVLNANTVLVYPNTPAKAREYQELMVRAFYLGNADVKQTLNMIKTLVKTRDVFIDEKLNLLVMRDTPDAIRLAEKLIATQDRAEPEVMLEVEVLEVKRSRLMDLGIQYPNTFTALNIANQTTQTFQGGTAVVSAPSQTQNILTVDTLKSLRGGNIAVSPNPQLNLKKEDGDVQILANPRIRVMNKQKAKIHIGDKVPVITTTSTANVGVSESVSYLDVGLKLDVEPTVYLDNEVGIKVGLEVSNIVREIRSNSGTLTYQIGTRNADTVLRLKDGETQILAGLISDEDRRSASKIPGLGDLPMLGHLFSTHHNEANKTEIILLITPHIIRNLTRLDANQSEFAAGTESSVGGAPLTLRQSPPEPASAPPLSLPGAVAPASSVASTTNAGLALSMASVPNVAKGQEFNVLVQASASSDVKSLVFDFGYDPARVEVVRVNEAAFMKQGGATTEFKSEPVKGSGRLTINVSRPSGGARGAGAVAVIVLRALTDSTAPTPLRVENAQAQDAAGTAVGITLPAPVPVTITP
ncbi:MAG: secretin N-terminal domain-containing protein [Sulfuriferula sp.]